MYVSFTKLLCIQPTKPITFCTQNHTRANYVYGSTHSRTFYILCIVYSLFWRDKKPVAMSSVADRRDVVVQRMRKHCVVSASCTRVFDCDFDFRDAWCRAARTCVCVFRYIIDRKYSLMYRLGLAQRKNRRARALNVEFDWLTKSQHAPPRPPSLFGCDLINISHHLISLYLWCVNTRQSTIELSRGIVCTPHGEKPPQHKLRWEPGRDKTTHSGHIFHRHQATSHESRRHGTVVVFALRACGTLVYSRFIYRVGFVVHIVELCIIYNIVYVWMWTHKLARVGWKAVVKTCWAK